MLCGADTKALSTENARWSCYVKSSFMPELDKGFIVSKIERAHRAKGNSYGTILPVIAKFLD